jgi:F-type H+-transporting ATPase subunit epsilon
VAATFRCSIVTPSQSLLSADANYVSFEAWDGQRGVMAGASPFLASLGIGVARIELADGTSKSFLVDSGFAQMRGSDLTLVADYAEDAQSLNRADAEREYSEARAKATEMGHTSPEERARVERAQRVAATKVALARA